MSNKEKIPFSERHPKINFLIGLLLLLIIIGIAITIIFFVIRYTGSLLKELAKLDAVVIVAIITGGVSILGVIISSIIGKSMEYKKSRNEYLAQKREEPYCHFVDLVYKIQESGKNNKKIPDDEIIKDCSKFSKQLTLWGSPNVAKKWNEFRNNGANSEKSINNIVLMEEIMNEMRKDLGTGKVKKGDLLGFFINDIDKYIK